MGNKTTIIIPPEHILNRLVGPKPVKWFLDRCDGCTLAPDLWFGYACAMHDYEYAMIKYSFTIAKGPNIFSTWWSAFLARREADRNLMINIVIMSKYEVDVEGNVSWKTGPDGFLGLVAAPIYFLAVRLFGMIAIMQRSVMS